MEREEVYQMKYTIDVSLEEIRLRIFWAPSKRRFTRHLTYLSENPWK